MSIGKLKVGAAGPQVLEAKEQMRRLRPQAVALSGPLFDFQTAMAVMSMQAQLNRPQTGELDDQLLSDYEQFVRTGRNFPPPADAGDMVESKDQAGARENIWERAKSELQVYGWTANDKAGSGNPKIKASARSEGTLRQGGEHLFSIYMIAGAPNANRCLVLSDEGVAAFGMPDGPAKTAARNQSDIGSWCGIFAVYCYRMAGLKVSPWSVGPGLRTKGDQAEFRALKPGEAPQRGDIGVLVEANHHFIVGEVKGGWVSTIDGNTDRPWGASVLSANSRSLSGMASKGTFYTPIWERVLG